MTVGSLVHLLQVGGGDVQLVEVTLAAGAPATSVAISDLDLPRDAAVVAVIRESRVLPPRQDTVLAVGDEVLLLASCDAEEAVRRFLVGP